MAGGLSKRPLRLKVDANDDDDDDDDGTNHNFPSSVHKVLSNDDVLMEILLRLPILSLHLFKPVCKQWLSLITSPSFTLTRNPNPTVDPPSGLFIRRWPMFSEKYDYDFVSFDPRIPTKRSIHPLVCLRRWIEQSCNGLLLCYIGDNNYVFNPSISMFKMLPPIHHLNYERNGDMNIAFDPTKSPCYKVVHVGSVEDDDDDDDAIDYFIRIQTYSSETCVWSVSDNEFRYEWFEDFSNGIYWNGAIHWLYIGESFHVKLDIADHPVLTKIQTPFLCTIKSGAFLDRKLFKSHDTLLLLCKDYVCSRHLNIYEMKNGYFVWSVKYIVNLDDMMRPYPTWSKPTNWSCDDMLSIILGERDEDSFVVIELSGTIYLRAITIRVRTLAGELL
ncbi:granule-bound starch synthase [Tanacetum coccineum]